MRTTKKIISIHAPSRERRTFHVPHDYTHLQFQSTLPRGSDKRLPVGMQFFIYFNPRSLAGATFFNFFIFFSAEISIHAPSRERQIASRLADLFKAYFNPRSLAGATLNAILVAMQIQISIHAPSRERPLSCGSGVRFNYFNPRSLAGATRHRGCYCSYSRYFNPRSLAGATRLSISALKYKRISIHAPSRERRALKLIFVFLAQFQSTLPRGSDYAD